MMYLKNSLFLMLLFVVLFVSSCKDEPCDDVICQNNGTCIDGICDCPDGFEGEFCEDFSRGKITGNFDVTSNCTGDAAETDEWAIGASASAFNEVLISNFHKSGLDITAAITESDVLEIEEQVISGAVNYTISGSGTIDGDGELSIQYQVIRDTPSDTTNCSVTAIRQ